MKAQPGYENNVNTQPILYESSTTWIWKQCKYITKQYYMKVAHIWKQCKYMQYYMKVAHH